MEYQDMKDIQIAFFDLSRKNTQDGFTMVEVLIALTLFIIGILTLMELQASSIRNIAAARIQTEATAIGKELIEHLRLLPVGHPDLNSGGNPHELKRNIYQYYTIRWEILDDPITKEIRFLKVIVTPFNQIYGKPVVIHTILGSEEVDNDEE
jgi:type II secretory pathway pseudopilin PulG